MKSHSILEVGNSTEYEANRYLTSKGTEGKEGEASPKMIPKLVSTKEEAFQTSSYLGARTQQTVGDISREADRPDHGKQFQPLAELTLCKTRISVL